MAEPGECTSHFPGLQSLGSGLHVCSKRTTWVTFRVPIKSFGSETSLVCWAGFSRAHPSHELARVAIRIQQLARGIVRSASWCFAFDTPKTVTVKSLDSGSLLSCANLTSLGVGWSSAG